MAIDVAPWLLRDYDPVGTYLKAFQTGASISAEQTRLAEQQRQANMDYMAKQEAMQQNILKAQVELQMEKAYREQRMSLENAQLEETKRRNDLVAQQAVASLAERMQQNQMMQQLRTSGLEETQRHNVAMETKPVPHFAGGGVSVYNPETGEVEVIKEPDAKPLMTPKAAMDLYFNPATRAMIESENPELANTLKQIAGGVAGTNATPRTVIRTTKDGRRVVFDAVTKQPLRFAD